jgi:hypothetical protein
VLSSLLLRFRIARFRTVLLWSLTEEELTHFFFLALWRLLSNLAAILVIYKHWLDDPETRNDLEYIFEAFQRLILQFALNNRNNEFMTR